MKHKLFRIFLLPFFACLILALLSGAGLAFVFLTGREDTPFAYAVFAFSAYSLTAACFYFSVRARHDIPRLRARLHSNRRIHAYLTDPHCRARVSLSVTFFVNAVYVLGNVILYFVYRSAWFLVLSGYYAVLALLRYLPARYLFRSGNPLRELRITAICATVLLLVNASLTAAVYMILYGGRGFSYPGFLIYAVAAYTFYITVRAVIEVVRYRNTASPILQMSKGITLSASLVAMLSLETAMLDRFGKDMPLRDSRFIIALTGGVIAIIVVFLSADMLVRVWRERAKLRSGAFDDGK